MRTITPLLGLAILVTVLNSSTRYCFAKELTTNAMIVENAPVWITTRRLNKISDKIERTLEWDIRRIHVIWYTDQAEFKKAHGYDDSVLAVTMKKDQKVLIGPKVTTANFDGVLGHELGHVIMYQKYKEAIPRWLEEGLANYVGGRGDIDYVYLKAELEKHRTPIRSLEHPFKESVSAKFHYMLSSAVMKMITSKCRISDLLQLSVGEKLESYLGTFCGIEDLDKDFKVWLDHTLSHALKGRTKLPSASSTHSSH